VCAFESLVAIVVDRGIRRPINVLMQERLFSAALVLTYSGMDTMAFLSMPAGKTYVMRSDFISWVNAYIAMPECSRIDARDLYAARCTVLHGGAASRLSQGGVCKPLRHVVTGPAANLPSEAVAIRLSDLAQAFFHGTDRFLADVVKDEAKSALVCERLEYLATTMPYNS
jgi:hypothetical protein